MCYTPISSGPGHTLLLERRRGAGDTVLPFGPTPISKAGECRLAARVGVLGSVAGDPRILKVVRPGEALKIERLMA